MTKNKRMKINWIGYVFILPSLLFFSAYILYPILFLTFHSLFKWSTLSESVFVGFKNYNLLFHDTVFLKTIVNSLIWIAVTIPTQAVLGFFLAYIIEERLGYKKNRDRSFLKSVLRTIMFFPVVTSVVVVAIIWSKILQPYQGITGYYLNKLFALSPTINILGDAKIALAGTMIANIWEWTGWSMIMFVGGMSQIPDDFKEAARIDGANSWQEIIYVFIPSLKPVIKSLLMLGIIGSLQTYALVNIMTNGGPNHATEMPGTYIFLKGFTQNQMGYACTISVSILIFALFLTVIQVIFLGSGSFMKKGE